MKLTTFILILALVSIFKDRGQAGPMPRQSDPVPAQVFCSEKKFPASPREFSKIHPSYSFTTKVSFFEAAYPQGFLVFFSSPDKSMYQSRKLINALCSRGFSIAAFDIIAKNKKWDPWMYTNTGLNLATRAKWFYPGLRLAVYGEKSSALFAARASKKLGAIVHRTIIVDPIEDVSFTRLVTQLDFEKTRIFTDSPRLLRFFSGHERFRRPPLFFPSQKISTSVSDSAAMFFPFVNFIESDFAAVVPTELRDWKML